MLRQLSYESYTPEGFIDAETEVGDVVEGEWRNENIGESVYRKVTPEKLQKTPNLSEITLLIISGDLARFPGNGRCFENN